MTPQELRELYERETSEWTDAELIAVINSRYEPTKVPLCRVCGGELSIGAIGGGSPTRYGCMADNAAHYSESSWEDRRQGGDSTVLELIERFSRQNADVLARGESAASITPKPQ
jgi:hypothetical protein